MLKKYSLQRQLIIIFVLIAIVIITVLVPLINKNLTGVIDDQMYDTLEVAQKRYIYYNYDYGPIENANSKQIYNMKYYPDEGTLIHSNNISNSDAKILYNVFAKDLAMVIKKDKDLLHDKGTDFSGDTIYYLITKYENIYYISLVYSDYSSDLVSAFQQQVINIMYLALAIVAIVVFVWVSTLIKPLRQITKYIENIRNDKESELKIERGDEIGIVSSSLVTMKEELDKQNKIKEEMIHNISHDLKTPIALIKSYSQSVKDDVYPYGDKNSSMDVIIENAERLDNKVRSLLYLNRLDFISGENIDSEVDMKELIDHIVLQLQGMHPEIKIESDLAFVTFKGDEECWRICVENIIENAFRYVKSRIKIELKANYLEIYNDGEPIDSDDIDALFQPYEKGTKGQFGLGLSIVYKTCTMYGFKVKAINHDVGVSFIISKDSK
ncbi:HAMP domain-containing sensor histidine kinase [Thomasclavelia sp.]|uniref:HAMP domain-containing sensor histidine kinase n=1 Tax=Thomasclavelia sp. TaxID=3025757 RepID=UPI0025EA25BC|nr:HAMP domain-containing sensor histidine kinase [Thomasclavelia sp.]